MIKKAICLILILWSVSAAAQTKVLSEKDYARTPHWIAMMDREGVNYLEALKAFNIYWQHHEMPEEEGDRVHEKNPGKKISKKELRDIRNGAAMRFQIKRFEYWKIVNEPFVKEDGTIMTPEEKLAYHKNQ